MAGLSDAEVFGTAPPAPAASRGLSDAEVFGGPTAGPRQRTSLAVPQAGREAPSSTWKDVGDVVRRIPPNANDFLSKTVGPLADTALAANSKLTGMKLTGQQDTGNFGHVFGSENLPPPASPAQRMADAGGKMIGETLPFLVGGPALALKTAKPAVDAAPTLINAGRNALHSMGQAITIKPIGSMAGETVAAGESGVFGEIARRNAEKAGLDENAQRNLEQLGQVAGPSAAHLFPSRIVMGAAKAAVPYARPMVESMAKHAAHALPENSRPAWLTDLANRRETEIRAGVGEKLQGALSTPESQAGLAEAERLQKEIPGFNPGIARATGDKELLNVQQSRDTASTGDNLRTRREAFDKSQGAIADKLDSVVPPAKAPRQGANAFGGQPAVRYPQDTVVTAGQNRVGAINDRIEGQRTALEGRLQADATALPTTDRIAQGGVLRNAREGAQRASDAETTRLRGEIADPQAHVGIEIPPAVEGEAATQMTVGQALDRRAAINQEMRDYTNASARTVEDVRRMGALQRERDTLDNAINRTSENNGSLRAYTTHYATQNVPDFRQGASAEVGRRDSFGYGGNRVDPEKVATKFFNPNEESAAAQFERSMAHDPAARQAMVDHALDDIRHNGVDPQTHQIKQGFVDKWLRKNERVLNQMPQTGAEIRAAVNARNPDAIYERIGQLEQRQRAVADSKLATVLQRTAGPGQAPENVVRTALNDPALMRQVMNSARGDEATTAAVRRAVFDQVRKEAPDVLSDPEKFLGWMKDKDRVLSAALTPQHKADLEIVARAAMLQNRLGRPQGTVGVTKSIVGNIQDALGITAASAASTMRGVAQGRTSLALEGVAQGTKFFNRQAERASNAAWDEALADPAAARMVASLARGKATPMQSAKLHAYLISAGVLPANERNDK